MSDDSHSHPDEARLVAYLDGELTPGDRAELSRHLTECRRCAASLDEIRATSEEFSAAVSSLEPPRSSLTAADVRRAGVSEDRASAGAGEDEQQAAGGSARTVALRIAASVAILFGVAAALPGSPVRSWIGRSVEEVRTLLFDARTGGDVEETPASPRTGAADSAEAVDSSGVAVGPADGAVQIRLVRVPETTRIRVRLVDGTRAGVWDAGGEYRTAAGSIEVAEPTSDQLLVELPRSVNRVRLEVNGTTAVLKEGSRLDVRVPGAVIEDDEFEFTAERGGTK